jgi:polar amino acid transport system substrate-binding protein
MFRHYCLYFRKKHIAAVLLWIACIPCAMAGNNKIEILTTDLPPWSIQGQSGIFVEIVQEIERRIGTNTPIQALPWSRSQAIAKDSENTIIFPLTRNKLREADYTWIADVMPVNLVFATYQGAAWDIDSAHKLNSIIVHQDSPAHLYLKEHGFSQFIALTTNMGTAPIMLASGHGDACFHDILLLKYMLKGTPLAGKMVFGPSYTAGRLYIAGSKNLSPEIINLYRKTFAELKADGTVDKIIAKYVDNL